MFDPKNVTGCYILDEQGEPVAEPDVLKWGMWLSRERRIVKQDRFGRVLVSTVFLGLDHSFGDEGPPVLWESMIFKGKHDQEQDRYTSQRAALEGHQLIVSMVLSDLSWWDRWQRPEWWLRWAARFEMKWRSLWVRRLVWKMKRLQRRRAGK